MNCVHSVTLAFVIFAAQSTLADDADNGKRQAQQHCSPCHIVEPNQRREVADSPPFETMPESTAMRLNRSRSRSSPRTLG